METLPDKKSSIFTCKSCKETGIKMERKVKTPSEFVNEPQQLIIKLEPAKTTHMDQKYVVKVGNKTIGFGSRGMSDFTINKSDERKQAYITRHSKREEQFWGFSEKDNILTAAFWARHLLWEFPSIFDAIKNIEDKTGITIKFTHNTIEKHQKKLAKSVKKSGEDLD